MKALILIDIQNDFMHGGSLPVPDAEAILPVVNHLSQAYPLVVATQDWHPAQHKSFARNHAGKSAFEQILWKGSEQTLWPVHCVAGTHGAQLHQDLATERINAIFRKGTDPDVDSYSAFFDNQRQKQTGLEGYLRGLGVTQVDFAGLAADVCVYHSVKDALSLGFQVGLYEVATRPIDAREFEKQKNALRKNPHFQLLNP